MAGSYKKLNNNKYKVRLEFGKDANGKRIRKFKTVETEAQAIKILNEHNYKRQINQVALPQKITFNQVADLWFENKVQLRCAKTTAYGYENILKNHVKPFFQNKEIQKIRKSDISNYYKSLINEKELSVNTVHKHHQLIRQVLNYAIDEKLIVENVALKIDLPEKESVETSFLNPNQMKLLLQMCAGHKLQIPIYICSFYGLRRSEFCGLKWVHIDFENKIINIKQARFSQGGEKFVKAPKNRTSYRTLHMSDTIIDLLQEHKNRQEFWKNSYKDRYTDSGYIYTNELGIPYKPNTLSEQFSRFIKKHKLPHVTLHGLRHSFCVLGIENGISIYHMSKALGHSSIKTTERVYAHLTDQTHKEAIETITNVLSNNN